MPLELIKEVNGVPEVDLLNKLHKVDIRSLQPGCDYDKKYIQVRIDTTQNSYRLFSEVGLSSALVWFLFELIHM